MEGAGKCSRCERDHGGGWRHRNHLGTALGFSWAPEDHPRQLGAAGAVPAPSKCPWPAWNVQCTTEDVEEAAQRVQVLRDTASNLRSPSLGSHGHGRACRPGTCGPGTCLRIQASAWALPFMALGQQCSAPGWTCMVNAPLWTCGSVAGLGHHTWGACPQQPGLRRICPRAVMGLKMSSQHSGPPVQWPLGSAHPTIPFAKVTWAGAMLTASTSTASFLFP